MNDSRLNRCIAYGIHILTTALTRNLPIRASAVTSSHILGGGGAPIQSMSWLKARSKFSRRKATSIIDQDVERFIAPRVKCSSNSALISDITLDDVGSGFLQLKNLISVRGNILAG